jgi:hypothetical protein
MCHNVTTKLASDFWFPFLHLFISTQGLFMKDNLGSDYLLLGHVDKTNARYAKGIKLGIEFRNEIDAWSMMNFKFRSQRFSETKYAHKDLVPRVYSLTSTLD